MASTCIKRVFVVLLLCSIVCGCYGAEFPNSWVSFIKRTIAEFMKSKRCSSVRIYPCYTDLIAGDPSTFTIPPVILWDPLGLEETDLGLRCPSCTSRLRFWRWTDASSIQNRPRVLFCLQERVLLVSSWYLCENHHQVIAHDPEVIQILLDKGMRIPFVLFYKCGLTKELLDFISNNIHSGISFQEVETIILNMYNSHHGTKACEYYLRTHGSPSSTTCSRFPHFEPTKYFIGRNMITHAYLRIFFECQDMFTQNMASKTGKWLSADHTFKVSANIGYWRNKKWVKMFNSIFIIMNEKSEVLAWQLTRGTSIDNVETLLSGLKERHSKLGIALEGFVIDNCCSLANKLKHIFGQNLPVKLDVFHAIKRILEKIPRKGVTPAGRTIRREMVKNLRLCFRDDSDLGDSRNKITPSPEIIVHKLKSFISKWSKENLNDTKVLPDMAINEIRKVMKHAQAGCLSGIPPGIGTNRNENLHKILQKWLKKDRIGIALAVALLSNIFYKLGNKDTATKGRAKKIFTPVTQWYSSFLSSGAKPSTEQFGVGQEHKTYMSNSNPLLGVNLKQLESCLEIEDSIDIECESISDDNCEDDLQFDAQQAEKISVRAAIMSNIATIFFGNKDASILANKYSWIDAPSMLLLFSHNECSGLRDYSESETRLDETLSNCGLERINVVGDGDCCFSSVSIGIDSFFDIDHTVCSHLHSINIVANQHKTDRISTLRKLVVEEWLGPNSEQYSVFLTSSHQLKFEEMALSFLNLGMFDCELGNSVLLALCNVLRIPIVIYSSINNYPIIPLLPQETPLSNVPIYVAFNQSGKGHYDAIVSVTNKSGAKNVPINESNAENGKKDTKMSCSCGRGSAKNKDKAFCNNYSSRCKCFQHVAGCSSSCRCVNCGNPYGSRATEHDKVQQRKRRKHDDVPWSSINFLERFGEPLRSDGLEDFEVFVLQHIVSKTQDIPINYDGIFEVFSYILSFAGFATIPSKDKVKRLVDKLVKARDLFTLTFKQEIQDSWHE